MNRRTYKNIAEEAFCKFIEEKGFIPQKRGWPDFFCTHKVTGEIMIVEVKSGETDYLKKHQEQIMSVLQDHGINSYRWDDVTETLTSIKKINFWSK